MQKPGPVPRGRRQTCPCMETEHLHALLCCWGLLQHKQKLWYLAFDLYKGISPFLLRSTVQLKPGTCCQGAVCSCQEGTAAPRQAVGPRELGHHGTTFPGGRGLSRSREGAAGTFVYCSKKTEAGLQEGLHCLLQCAFLSAVLKTGGLFSS